MENLELEIKKHERAIKILEAYKESDRRYNHHLSRFERNEKLFGWDAVAALTVDLYRRVIA